MRRLSVLKNILIFGLIVVLAACLIFFVVNYFNLKKENQQLLDKLEKDRVAVFFLKASPASFYLQPLLIKVPGSGDKHIEALEALFAGPPEGQALMNIFPAGTLVRNFTLKDGLAVVDLNQKATQLNVGSQGEALAVASIVDTLTKFPDVYQVKILIEGKEVESLAGHVDLTNTFHYNEKDVDPVPIVR